MSEATQELSAAEAREPALVLAPREALRLRALRGARMLRRAREGQAA